MSERLSDREHRSPWRDKTPTAQEFEDYKAANASAFNDLRDQLNAVTAELVAVRAQRDDAFKSVAHANDDLTKAKVEIGTLQSRHKDTPIPHRIPNSPVTDALAGRDSSFAGTGVEQGPQERAAGLEAERKEHYDRGFKAGVDHAEKERAAAAAGNPTATKEEKADIKKADQHDEKQAAQQTAPAQIGSPHPSMDKALGADSSMAGTGVVQGQGSEQKTEQVNKQISEAEKRQADAEKKRREEAARHK